MGSEPSNGYEEVSVPTTTAGSICSGLICMLVMFAFALAGYAGACAQRCLPQPLWQRRPVLNRGNRALAARPDGRRLCLPRKATTWPIEAGQSIGSPGPKRRGQTPIGGPGSITAATTATGNQHGQLVRGDKFSTPSALMSTARPDHTGPFTLKSRPGAMSPMSPATPIIAPPST